MSKRIFAAAIGFGMVLVALHIAGHFTPTALTWGFHFLAFLPDFIFISYCIIGLLWIAAIAHGRTETISLALSKRLARQPWQFLVAALVILFASALVFRVRVPLLGDSFFLIRNFSDWSRGISPLYMRNEPLATSYFMLFMKAFHPSNYDAFLNMFLVADLLLGTIYVVNMFFVARLLVEESTAQMFSFVLFLTLPATQLFFGYIETYPVLLCALSLHLHFVLRYLKRRLPLMVVGLSYAMLVCVHYLAILFLPSAFYLVFREFKARRIRSLLVTSAVIALLGIIILAANDFNLSRFTASVPHSHFLPLSQPTDPEEIVSSPYTMVSALHAVDLFNLFILMAPAPLFLLALTSKDSMVLVRRSPLLKFLVIGLVPAMLFLLTVKYDLGAARDWDVSACIFLMLAVYAAGCTFSRPGLHATRSFTLLVGLVLLHSCLFFGVNAGSESSVRRFQSLFDTRVLSQVAYYAGTLELAQYHHQVKNQSAPIEIWERYVSQFPNDDRGYQNIITNLRNFGPSASGRIWNTYERWLSASSDHPAARSSFAGYCLDLGVREFADGHFEEAERMFRRTLALDSTSAKAYNNLGSVLAEGGHPDQAVAMFHRAIAIDSTYADAWTNLGNAYADLGRESEARTYLRRAEALVGKLHSDIPNRPPDQ